MQIHFLLPSQLNSNTNLGLRAEGVIVVMPFTEKVMAEHAAKLMASRAATTSGKILCIHDEHRVGFVQLINLAFRATQSAYFAYVAQDAFAGRYWLELALKALGDRQHLLGFNDGKWAGALAGFGLARRSWASQNYGGDFFFPQYQRHYADAELTLFAMQAGVYAYEPNSVLVEVDWQKENHPVHLPDQQLFSMRKKTGFNGRVTQPALLDLVS